MAIMSRFLGALIIAVALISAPSAAFAGVFVGIGISVNIAPPPLPVYVQPPVLVADEIWTPGYWAYGPYGYYWVPGTWVAAPQVGYLWTPGYWGYGGGAYVWHAGYWGPHIGFYGGVNYGCGYNGFGYVGGGWNGNHFQYNTAITNVNRTNITNVYVNRTVINERYTNTTYNRVSYNGGPEGIAARPTAQELEAQREPHFEPTAIQQQHVQIAAQNRNYLASVNNGRPENAALAMPLSRENRPANFVPAGAGDRPAPSDAFARFNQDRGVAPDAYRGNAAQNGAYHDNAASAAYRAPGDNTPAYREPAYHQPAYQQQPAYRQPAYQEQPAYHQPAYQQPADRQPAYHAPAYHAPASHAPAEREHHDR